MTPSRAERERNDFAGLLLLARARASREPGTWKATKRDNGLEVGWRVRDSHEEIALRRSGRMVAEEDMRFVLEIVSEHLDMAVAERKVTDKMVRMALIQTPCTECGWPVDVEAMLSASLVCMACADESKTRCADCGRIIEREGFDVERCVRCATRAGKKIDAERRAARGDGGIAEPEAGGGEDEEAAHSGSA